MLTYDRANHLFSYREDGNLVWKVCLSNRKPAGSIVGGLTTAGYRKFRVDGKYYLVHRVIYLLHNKKWPEGDIDHQYGIRSDNRIGEIRDVSHSVNLENQHRAKSHNRSGVLGVWPSGRKNKPWRSAIVVNGKAKHIGRFATIEETSQAYLNAKRELHEGCTI